MKSLIFVVGLVFALLFGVAVDKAYANPTSASSGTTWGRWNIAPWASSFEEACRKNNAAIDGSAMPADVKAKLKSTIGPTCSGGKEVWLTPNQKLNQMWSGGENPHPMDNVTVGQLPVTKSPDGRTYRQGAVAQAARALEWRVQGSDGKTYVWVIPFVCFNAAWYTEAPTLVRVDCPKIMVTVPPSGGQVLKFIGMSYTGRIPSSESCPFVYRRVGEAQWYALPTECPEGLVCPHDELLRAARRREGFSGGIDLIGQANAAYEFQVSPEFVASEEYIYAFCVVMVSGDQTCGKDIRTPDYAANLAVIGNTSSDHPSGWDGKVRVWCWYGRQPCHLCH